MVKDQASLALELFANLLDYPTPALAQQAQSLSRTLLEEPDGVQGASQAEAVALVTSFQDNVEKMSPKQVEELYTSTFDMQPLCYPYVGYHLFGESYKRGAFMAQLNEGYRSFGYQVEKELPDYVPAILRFLAVGDRARQSDFCRGLLSEGLAPAVSKMASAFNQQSQNPYAAVIAALHLFLAAFLLGLNPEAKQEMKHA
jgi:nitrate reductase molybdenum cofactor assembly chaperone NarJ/NarW